MNKKSVILKVGGSLVSVKSENGVFFDFEYVDKLVTLLKDLREKKIFDLLVCVIGGGYLNKVYLESCDNFISSRYGSKLSDYYRDNIGIMSLNLNAQIFLSISSIIFSRNSLRVYPDVIKDNDMDNLQSLNLADYDLLVVGAAKPGHSTDMDAFLFAKFINTDKVISLKNVDGVYSEDPKINPNATFYKHLTWQQYSTILGDSIYTPRSHFPVDVTTSKASINSNIKFIILDGSNLSNLKDCLEGKVFDGSIIG